MHAYITYQLSGQTLPNTSCRAKGESSIESWALEINYRITGLQDIAAIDKF